MEHTHFVYCPRSGSRWIKGPDSRTKLPCTVWPNGSAHVHGKKISVYAAEQGIWYRDIAGEIAEYVSSFSGGVAWDANGEISVVIPSGPSGTSGFTGRAVMFAFWIGKAERYGTFPRLFGKPVFTTDETEAIASGLFTWWQYLENERNTREPYTWESAVDDSQDGSTSVYFYNDYIHDPGVVHKSPWTNPVTYGHI